MINRIVLVGRLTADPEERHTNTGTELCKFRIAVDRNRKNAEGEKETDFFNVVCFGFTAQFVNRYLGRGDLVGVEGRCQIDEYTDRDGQRQKWIEVAADNVQSLGRSEGGGGRGGGGGGSRGRGRDSDWDHAKDDDFGDGGGDPEDKPARAERPERDARPPRDEPSRSRDDDEPESGRRSRTVEKSDSSEYDSFADDDDDPFADS